MRRISSLCFVLFFLFSLCGCVVTNEYEFIGSEIFDLPENKVSSYTLRHKGQTILYFNYERGDRCEAYQSALRNLKLNKTNKKGSMDSNLYEISTDYTVYEYSGSQVKSESYRSVKVRIIVNQNMILYNDQWYEADTSQLLRQLERDFADVA